MIEIAQCRLRSPDEGEGCLIGGRIGVGDVVMGTGPGVKKLGVGGGRSGPAPEADAGRRKAGKTGMPSSPGPRFSPPPPRRAGRCLPCIPVESDLAEAPV